jgi:membrane protein implicated in regulation of membrane protease activity
LQVILFPAFAVLTLWLFREKMLELTRGRGTSAVDSLIGETAVAQEEILVKGIGKVEMHGTSWTARNLGETPLARGARCKVERVEGLTVFVRAEQA